MPHLALPALAGYLRRRGHTVLQRDLNAEAFDEILTRKALRQALDRIQQRFGTPAGKRPTHGSQPDAGQIQQAIKRGKAIAESVEAAKAILRSPDFYEPARSEPAFDTIHAALELYSLAYYPARLELTGFTPAIHPDRSSELLKGVRDTHTNPFYELFSRTVVKDIQNERPDLVGISVPTMGQFLPAMTLAACIRDAGLTCHITVGGPHITMLRGQLPQVPRLFQLIDSAVAFDGEIPLLRLAETLEQKGSLADVPSLIYADPAQRSEIHTNPTLEIREARAAQENELPDFEGLALGRYLAPEPVLPLATSHGCYHGKCGFCNVGYGNPFHYYPYPVEQVTAQVEALRAAYHCRHIFFVDEAITPRMLRQLGAAYGPGGTQAEINWCGAARFEKSLSDPILTAIGAAGCRMLLFGLESASEPVMRRMIKGTVPDEMSRILRTGTRAGIWNHTFFFFGFPGETLDNAQETVNFVYAHQDAIHSTSPGAFVLERDSPAYRDPAGFGITGVHPDPQADLAIYFEYETAQGLDEETANSLADSLIAQLPDKRNGQYYIQDVYKFLYASELHRRGQPLPGWIE